MKVAATVAEYNPFHNGHQYHIEQTRRETGADFILVIMSGDFVQRGAPAITNKYVRTKMALLGGADAVIELPALYALSSAEFFAGGAVTLLNHLNVADFLSFGSESGNLSLLTGCARTLVEKEEMLQSVLKKHLKTGKTYPAARTLAIHEIFEINITNGFSDMGSDIISDTDILEQLDSLLTSPNNILGLEYCKALFAAGSSIHPFTLKRNDKGYHSTVMETPDSATDCGFASASAIRRAIFPRSEMPSSFTRTDCPDSLSAFVPEKALSLLKDNFHPVTEDSFSHLLYYKLLTEASEGFTDYLDCTPDLSDKICKNLPEYTGFSAFCTLLKSKELTYARISRVLTHILLNIKTPDYFKPSLTKRELFTPYARLLGFRQGSEPLLSAIKKNSSIPLISKLADARFLLNDRAFSLLQQDVYCACIYESAKAYAAGKTVPNEWKISPVII